jgi:hypothetical protein
MLEPSSVGLMIELAKICIKGNFLLIYICNFHVLNHLLLIYIFKLHWNLNVLLCIKALHSFGVSPEGDKTLTTA